MKIAVTIKGKTPLLMCKFTESDLKPNKKSNKNATPEEKAEPYAYRNAKGELYIPALCVFSSIVEGGKGHKKGKNKVTTLKRSMITSAAEIIEQECLLGTKEFEVDSRSGVVPATGGRIMIHRPMLSNWEISFTLKIDTNEFSNEEMRAFVDDAGSKCGLLAYRPSCKGWFGKYYVTAWKVLKDGK